MVAADLFRRACVGVRVCLTVFILTSIFIATATRVAADESVVTIYGFLRLDQIYDDSRMQHPQYAFWSLSEDPEVGRKNREEFTVHPRVTRFGVKINPEPPSERWKMRGVIEMDFQNGGSESRATPRMRLAYFSIFNNHWQFLAGQDWDIISPLYPTCHTDGILWNAGNLGDRRPQATVVFTAVGESRRFRAELSLAQAGAVDGQNLDRNSRVDAVDAATPQLQVRLGVDRGMFGRTLAIGAWGHYAQTRTEMDIAGKTRFDSWSTGVDATVPLGSRVTLKGEAWTAQNASDVRGGIGQGVNTLTGEEIETRGGWGEVGLKVSDPLSLYVGASIDDPKNAQLPSSKDLEDAGLNIGGTGRARNQVTYLSTRWRPWAPFLVGIEYFYWVTEYRGLDDGKSNRVNLHFSYSF